jgi:two-component system, response regulator RegA
MARIAVLDDVADQCALLKRILERKGHTVTTFTDEERAVAHIAAAAPDLAILDIKLKKMTGVEVLEEIRKRSPATRVIMLTGYPTLETAARTKERGALEYLVKPLDKAEIEKAVERILSLEQA